MLSHMVTWLFEPSTHFWDKVAAGRGLRLRCALQKVRSVVIDRIPAVAYPRKYKRSAGTGTASLYR